MRQEFPVILVTTKSGKYVIYLANDILCASGLGA